MRMSRKGVKPERMPIKSDKRSSLWQRDYVQEVYRWAFGMVDIQSAYLDCTDNL